MIDLFQVEKNGVVFRPEVLAIKEFRAVWERDKTKDKKRAFQEMSFLFFVEDLRSPFKLYLQEEKEIKVIESVFKDEKWKPDKLIEAARVRYRELTKTRSMQLLQDTWISMDNMGKFLRSVQYETTKDAAAMKGVLEKMPQMVATLKKLEDEVRKELEDAGVLKGGREKGLFEDPT